MIQKERWTIKAAAQEIGIKLCTAKHILYLYRKEGKIYRKKGEIADQIVEESEEKVSPLNNLVYVPIPLYVLCYYSPEMVPINLDPIQQS